MIYPRELTLDMIGKDVLYLGHAGKETPGTIQFWSDQKIYIDTGGNFNVECDPVDLKWDTRGLGEKIRNWRETDGNNQIRVSDNITAARNSDSKENSAAGRENKRHSTTYRWGFL